MKNIKQIKKELGLKDAVIAEIFGYKKATSYTTSSAKPRIERGIEELYRRIKQTEGKK
ncbi:hypothetical protein ACXA18_09635 [Riemerella anatipestifer]|uniref:Uncharacterized protein n=1 Tax=Riemerella anatipestifer TaxID=34085 RepID=A0AAP6HII6_RIEAN|nr:hypothetical protein [Riemerella anatipestifer]MBT0527112.1 hypothetical protein [Riemerella anatipestifer]MCD5969565.1 hypothetical protein [Riemerella anatipestifer]MCU7571638.1 hypothetical protein [Riemerella anatipestifer]MDR7817096.1 hypothetical protein [Riemerella anatipestifer]MDR7849671.1 hypothetical protein [Riemerella anatipestifer]